jgi:hypothetical protein
MVLRGLHLQTSRRSESNLTLRSRLGAWRRRLEKSAHSQPLPVATREMRRTHYTWVCESGTGAVVCSTEHAQSCTGGTRLHTAGAYGVYEYTIHVGHLRTRTICTRILRASSSMYTAGAHTPRAGACVKRVGCDGRGAQSIFSKSRSRLPACSSTSFGSRCSSGGALARDARDGSL